MTDVNRTPILCRTLEERYEFETGNPGDERCAAVRSFDDSVNPRWSAWRIKLLSHADYCTQWVDDYMDLGEAEFPTWREAVDAKMQSAAARWKGWGETE